MDRLFAWLQGHATSFVALALATCLTVKHSDFSFIVAYLFLYFVLSRFRSIEYSIDKCDDSFIRSQSGVVYFTILIQGSVMFYLALFHGDGIGEFESPLKRMLIAYTIFFCMDRHPLRPLVLGAALGALGAAAAGTYEYVFLGLDRVGGPTNAIRFGSLALLFSAVSLIGLLFVRNSTADKIILAAGAMAGLYASVLSGSRGAMVALPVFALLILPRLWAASPRAVMRIVAAAAAFALVLYVFDIGSLWTRLSTIGSDIMDVFGYGKQLPSYDSDGQRFRMLGLAYELFRENPLLGAGSHGWVEGVAGRRECCGLVEQFSGAFSQAHNQFADDFAKGGIIRGVAGIALMFVPLVFFLQARPFSDAPGSTAALLGVVSTAGFIVFSLSDSMMLLSLPASVHAILVCYLMSAVSRSA